MLPLLLLTTACDPDQGLFVYPIDTASPVLDTGTQADSGADTEPDTDDGSSGEQDNDPRPPQQGQLVISELMIDPAGVADETGEWIELFNDSPHPLDLGGLILGDEGVDGALVAFFEQTLPPGKYLVLCASEVTNGGVDCQGTYLYQTFGGGFALSNSSDEVVLIGADGARLDTVRYGEGVAVPGQSLGVSPGCLDAASNDAASCWCPQSGSLSSGDSGNPGTANGGC